eukprot:Skav203401  [mRNA]  locus=scaffold1743:73613:74976:- [translate_table: standard]
MPLSLQPIGRAWGCEAPREINCRQVMGLYPGDPGPPGADCGATVLGLGDSVKHLRLADDVFGESPGCLSTYNTSSAALLTQKPSSWSYEEERMARGP